jgi:hypothetical protein
MSEKKTLSFFEKNVQLFLEKTSLPIRKTSFLQQNTDYQRNFFFRTKEEEGFQKYFQKENFFSGDVLCFYGIDAYPFYEEFQKNKKKKAPQKLIFLEDDFAHLCAFLQLKEAQKILTDDSVEMVFISSDIEIEKYLEKISWESVFLSLIFSSSFLYQKHKFPKGEKIRALLEEKRERASLLLSLYQDYGIQAHKNIFSNLSHLGEFRDFSFLKGKFSHIPALIVGAGPSLEKEIDRLTSYQKRAVFFAGGSSLPILSLKGISPHFIAGMDLSAPYERFKETLSFEKSFFFQNSFSQEIFSLVHGEKFPLPPSGLYPLENFLSLSLDLPYGIWDGGWTVSCLLLSMAQYLGFSPIILVGMDFCLYEKKRYASNLPLSEKEKKDEYILTKNLQNEKVFTKKDWLMAKRWIEDFISNHKETEFFQTSEKGLGFLGMENRSFKEIDALQIGKEKEIEGLLHTFSFQAPKKTVDKKVLGKCFEEIGRSLNSTKKLLQEKKEFLESCYHRKDFEDALLLQQKNLALDIALKEEILGKYFLFPLWEVWKYPFSQNFVEKKEKISGDFSCEIQRMLFFFEVIEQMEKIL